MSDVKLMATVVGEQVERLGPGEHYAICNRLEDGQGVEVHEHKCGWCRVSKWHWPDLYDYDQQDSAYMVKGKVARWLPAYVLYQCTQKVVGEWILYGKSWDDFCGDGLNYPGVLVDDGVNVDLIGSINDIGGVCDYCYPMVSQNTVKRYMVLITVDKLKELGLKKDRHDA